MPSVAIRFAESAIADLEAIRTWYEAVKERIYKDKKFSDHAPLIIDYDHTL